MYHCLQVRKMRETPRLFEVNDVTVNPAVAFARTVRLNGSTLFIDSPESTTISVLVNVNRAATVTHPACRGLSGSLPANCTVTRPTDAELLAHFGGVNNMRAGDEVPLVAAWMANLRSYSPVARYEFPAAVDVVLPLVYGSCVEVILVADNALSNMLLLNCSDPALNRPPLVTTYVVPNMRPSALMPWNVMRNGETGAQLWSHSFITFNVTDPKQGGPDAKLSLFVVVGGQMSNWRSFAKPVPNINGLATQGAWFSMDTVGGQVRFRDTEMMLTSLSAVCAS